MSLGLAFYIIMLIWFLGGLWWTGRWNQGPAAWGSDFLLFVLFLLLGWKVFGAPLHG